MTISPDSMDPAEHRPLRPWDVWLAYVRFADHPDVGKVRPVVVIDPDSDVTAIVSAKVTTAAPQERFPSCELADWEAEGLARPSRVQVEPLFRVGVHEFLRNAPLGRLTTRDIAALQNALDTVSHER